MSEQQDYSGMKKILVSKNIFSKWTCQMTQVIIDALLLVWREVLTRTATDRSVLGFKDLGTVSNTEVCDIKSILLLTNETGQAMFLKMEVEAGG